METKPLLRAPEAVLFDLDGTLLDSLSGIQYSVEAAFAECGLTMTNLPLRSLIGPPIRTILSRMSSSADEYDLDCLEKSFRSSYDSEGWQRTHHYAGAVELLKKLRIWGIRLFVISNKPLHISAKILDAAGTLKLFESIMTRDSREPAYAGKAEIMSCCLAMHGIRSHRCLMVGDTMEDAEAAAYNGIQFCLMTHGYGNIIAGSGVPVVLQAENFASFMSKAAREWKSDRQRCF